MTRSLSLLLALACACTFTSCSFTKAGRQQRAYEKYVRKSSASREKQRSHFRSKKPQMPSQPMTPSEPVESHETGPQAAPSDG